MPAMRARQERHLLGGNPVSTWLFRRGAHQRRPPAAVTRRVAAILVLRRQKLQQMAIRILEIASAPAIAMLDFHVIGRTRATSVRNSFILDPPEDGVEFRFAHLEGVVVP